MNVLFGSLLYLFLCAAGYRKKRGTYKGSFAVVCSYIGYQARGALPTNFDVTYAYNLGFTATALVAAGFSGYIAVINKLKRPVEEWVVSGVPITALLSVPTHDPAVITSAVAPPRPLIRKATVDLNGPAYQELCSILRAACGSASSTSSIDTYSNPGPVQYFGPSELTDSVPLTLSLESYDYLSDIQSLHQALARIEQACRPGCPSTVLQIATKSLINISDIIQIVNQSVKK